MSDKAEPTDVAERAAVALHPEWNGARQLALARRLDNLMRLPEVIGCLERARVVTALAGESTAQIDDLLAHLKGTPCPPK